MTTQTVSPSRFKLWMAAIKPPMYSVAVIPISVGTAIAFWQQQQFDATIYTTFLGAAIAIIAWLNLSNDFFDSQTGIDRNKPHSVVNLTNNPPLVFWVSNLCLALGFLGIGAIAWWQKDPTIVEIVALCCALGYSYQGPPFRFGYQGLGEFICFFTFGPLAVLAAYYSQVQSFSMVALWASVIIGISTSLILFCSHFHQVEDDLAAGKRSPIVRLGTKLGSQVLVPFVGSIFVLTGLLAIAGIFPLASLVILASFPFGYQLIRHVVENHDRPQKVSNCKFIAVNLHFLSGVLLALGFVIPAYL